MRAIPDTRKGRFIRRLFTGIGIVSVVGVADQLRELFWLAVFRDGPDPLPIVVLLVGWALLLWMGFRAYRHHDIPPTWVMAIFVVLPWVHRYVSA